jgi:hypothetical protein
VRVLPKDYAAKPATMIRKMAFYVKEKVTDPNKGNNKITELRTILQRESQNS